MVSGQYTASRPEVHHSCIYASQWNRKISLRGASLFQQVAIDLLSPCHLPPSPCSPLGDTPATKWVDLPCTKFQSFMYGGWGCLFQLVLWQFLPVGTMHQNFIFYWGHCKIVSQGQVWTKHVRLKVAIRRLENDLLSGTTALEATLHPSKYNNFWTALWFLPTEIHFDIKTSTWLFQQPLRPRGNGGNWPCYPNGCKTPCTVQTSFHLSLNTKFTWSCQP